MMGIANDEIKYNYLMEKAFKGEFLTAKEENFLERLEYRAQNN